MYVKAQAKKRPAEAGRQTILEIGGELPRTYFQIAAPLPSFSDDFHSSLTCFTTLAGIGT